MTIKELLNHDAEFRYQMLDRMKQDCNYYLNNGNRQNKYLWAQDEAEQIKYMKALWNSFPENEKPEWLSYKQICEYKEAFEKYYAVQTDRGIFKVPFHKDVEISHWIYSHTDSRFIKKVTLIQERKIPDMEEKGLKSTMNVKELSTEELTELKQNYYKEKNENVSMDELLSINDLVSDEEVYDYYSDYSFTKEDFYCNENDTEINEELYEPDICDED